MIRRALGVLFLPSVVACSLFLDEVDLTNTDRRDDAIDGGDASDVSVDAPDPIDGDAPPLGEGDACVSNDPSLVLFFPFDGDGGDLARDCSKSGLVGQLTGKALSPATGRVAGAVDLDGVTTCLDLGSAPAFMFDGKPFTVAAWIKPRQYFVANKTGRWILSRKIINVNGWHFGTDDPDVSELDLDVDGGKVQAQAPVPLGAWSHVAMVYEPGVRVSSYVNGVLVKAQTNNVPPTFGVNTTARLRIGCSTQGSNHFDGLVDELRVYDRALSAPDIAALAK